MSEYDPFYRYLVRIYFPSAQNYLIDRVINPHTREMENLLVAFDGRYSLWIGNSHDEAKEILEKAYFNWHLIPLHWRKRDQVVTYLQANNVSFEQVQRSFEHDGSWLVEMVGSLAETKEALITAGLRYLSGYHLQNENYTFAIFRFYDEDYL